MDARISSLDRARYFRCHQSNRAGPIKRMATTYTTRSDLGRRRLASLRMSNTGCFCGVEALATRATASHASHSASSLDLFAVLRRMGHFGQASAGGPDADIRS